jgi:hypothetical protein
MNVPLSSGKTKKMAFDINKEEKLVRKWLSLKDGAKDRKLPFGLSLAKLKRLMTVKTCYYTGLPFDDKSNVNCRSIDRVDSEQGYVDDNTVACLAWVNSLKGRLNYPELKLLVKGIERHYAKRKLKLPTKKVINNEKKKNRLENTPAVKNS